MDKQVKEKLKQIKKHSFLFLVPPCLGALLWFTYQLAPEFYLQWILQPYQREAQLVEAITFLAAISAGFLLAFSGCIFRDSQASVLSQKGVLLLFITSLAAFFFAGEEISWGQSLIGWETPKSYQSMSLETNLHNTGIPIQSLGSIFIIFIFFILPGVDRYKPEWISENIKKSIPAYPAVFCIAFGFIWKFIKEGYQLFYDADWLLRDAFYVEFVEQINEQKEMFFAIGLLMYGYLMYSKLRMETLSGSSGQEETI